MLTGESEIEREHGTLLRRDISGGYIMGLSCPPQGWLTKTIIYFFKLPRDTLNGKRISNTNGTWPMAKFHAFSQLPLAAIALSIASTCCHWTLVLVLHTELVFRIIIITLIVPRRTAKITEGHQEATLWGV